MVRERNGWYIIEEGNPTCVNCRGWDGHSYRCDCYHSICEWACKLEIKKEKCNNEIEGDCINCKNNNLYVLARPAIDNGDNY